MGPADGILTWLYQERKWAEEQNRVLVRVEMAPEHWDTLRREFGLHGPTGIQCNKVFGLPLRVLKGLKAPQIIAAGGSVDEPKG